MVKKDVSLDTWMCAYFRCVALRLGHPACLIQRIHYAIAFTCNLQALMPCNLWCYLPTGQWSMPVSPVQVDHAVEQIQAVEHAAAQQQVAAITQELQEMQALAAQSQVQLSAAEAAHKNEREAGLRELDVMRTSLENVNAESARLLTQRAELEASLSIAQQEKEAAVTQASEHAAQSTGHIARLEGTVADVQERLAQAEASLSASAEAQAQLQADRDELAAALGQTADALQKSESALRELQDRHSTLATAHERCSELGDIPAGIGRYSGQAPGRQGWAGGATGSYGVRPAEL